MRILLINHFPLEGSGSGVYTKNIVKKLMEKGHEVSVIMPENTTEFKKIENVRMNPVYFKKNEVIEGQLPFNFPCFTTHPTSTNTFSNLTDNELELYLNSFDEKIKEEVEKFKPDVIHCQHIWLLSSLCNTHDIPLVITTHGTDLLGYQKEERFHEYVEEAISKCSKVITVSKDNDILVKRLFPFIKNKTFFMKNSYDGKIFYKEKCNREKVLAKYNIDNKYKNIISYVGKLTYIKGVDTLLDSIKELDDKNTFTIIVGNGELFDDLNKKKEELNLKNVKFIGNIDQDSLREVYSIADVSVVPSRSEAFGLVAVEALACGTPVIATNQGGLPDIINDEVGILFEVGNSKELANNIKTILNNKEKYPSSNLEKYARDNYEQDNVIDDLINVYDKAIKEYESGKIKKHIK